MPDTLMEQLIRHEGLRLFPYVDSVGKVTIGVGRNLTDVGISHDEALSMLAADVVDATNDLAGFPWFRDLNEARRRALIDMRFNLGPTRFRGFVHMLAALRAGNYQAAAREMRASKWSQQVSVRAETLARMLETGLFADAGSVAAPLRSV